MTNIALQWTLYGVPLFVYMAQPLLLGFGLLACRRIPMITRSFRSSWTMLSGWSPWACVLITGIVALFFAVLLSLSRWPHAMAHDEFAYLLAADTFCHGRLTNEPHDHWQHFQSYHILCQPTYQAKFPPGQSMALALGQFLFGLPLAGVWMSYAAACAATTWMLLGCFPKRWAFLGGLFSATNPALLYLWSQSYWGGAVAMLGGAILYGSYFRMVRKPRWYLGLLMGAGLLILANSRPYEGMLASIPVACFLLYWLWTQRSFSPFSVCCQLVLPVLLILLVGACWMTYFNFRVTGNPLKMPYMEWLDQNGVALSRVLALPDAGSTQEHRVANFAGGLPRHMVEPKNQIGAEEAKSLRRLAQCTMLANYSLCFGGCLLVSLIALPSTYRRREGLLAVIGVVIVFAAVIFGHASGFPHYAAPVAPLTVLIAVSGLRFLSGRNPQLVRVVPHCWFGSLLLLCAIYPFRKSELHDWRGERHAIIQRLEATDGDHLIVATFESENSWKRERIYNLASIDDQRIVWARDLGPVSNKSLMDYYSDRSVWRLRVTAAGAELVPFRVEPRRHD